METRIWKDADGKMVSDETLWNWIEASKNKLEGDYELLVGADSHLHGRSYRFITVVCLYQKGRGGFYYYTTSERGKKDFKGTYPVRVKAKLFHETELSIEVASEILEKTHVKPIIHLDASIPSAGEMTSLFSDQLRGYVVGSGFEAVLKPFSFCASGIANKHSK